MLGAQDPLADGQQGGVLVAGPGRMPRLPGPGGEVVPPLPDPWAPKTDVVTVVTNS